MMELKHLFKISVLFVTLFSFLNFVGFTGLERYIELEGLVHARTSADFTKSAGNISAVLSRGTQGEILESTQFKSSGNFGLKIKISSGLHQGKVFWVYYDKKFPKISLYKTLQRDQKSNIVEVTSPRKATSAKLIEDQRGYRDATSEAQSSMRPAPRSQSTSSSKPVSAVDEVALVSLISTGISTAHAAGSSDQIETCIECRNTPKECSNKDDYLETELVKAETEGSSLLQQLLKNPKQKGQIKKECVQFSQRTFTPSVDYGVCSNNGQFQRGQKPCSSNRLANVVTNSFNLIASCMSESSFGSDSLNKGKLESIYKMISVESGFHLNAISSEDAAGFGQFLPGAIKYINRTELNSIKEKLSNSKNRNCQDLNKEFLAEPMSSEKSGMCSRTSIRDGNPAKNIIYTFAYYLANRKFVESEIFEKRMFSERINLNESEKETLLNSLARWTHNSGPGGMSRPLKALIMHEFSQKSPATTADQILSKLSKYMVTHPHPAYQKVSADGTVTNKPLVKEVSGYFNKTERVAEQLQQAVGVNSCIN